VILDETLGQKKKLLPWAAENGVNLEYYCEMISEFEILQDEWGFANGPGSGANKFKVFRQLLTRNALNLWDPIVTEHGFPRNAVNFKKCQELLVESVANEKPRNRATQYLENRELIGKRIGVTCAEHGARLANLFRMHDLLPGDTASFMGNEPHKLLRRKMILFNSFPEAWRQEFIKQHDEPHYDRNTWQKILRKMENYKTDDDVRREASRARNAGRGYGGRGQSRGGGRGHMGGRGNGRMRSHGGRGYSRSSSFNPYPNQNYGNYPCYGYCPPTASSVPP